jgi:sucrose-6-phosphate hydrolase SacC (GH32 family)
MPFNQQMGIACELSLVTTENGVLMRAEPVRELVSLRSASRSLGNFVGEGTVAEDIGELVDLEAVLSVPAGNCGGLLVRGVPITWDREEGVLDVAGAKVRVAASGDALALRVLVDRGSVEVFAAEGLVAVAKGTIPEPDERSLRVLGEQTRLGAIIAHELDSIWQ